MRPEDVEVGMHIIRPSNELRAVVVGEPYINPQTDVWMAPVFYINPQNDQPWLSKDGWFVVHFEPDPKPPVELWSMYCARVLQGQVQ